MLAAVAFSLGVAAAAFAHGDRPALVFWGAFPPGAADCQRAIATGTRQCVMRLWQVRLGCFRHGCEPGAIEAAKQAGRQRARTVIQRVCSDQEVRLLQFTSLAEALVDSREGCLALDTAFDSAVFGPLARVDPAPEVLACVEHTAAAVTAQIREMLTSRQRVLDRIATLNLEIDGKGALRMRSDERIRSVSTAVAARAREGCAGTLFEQLYGMSPEQFTETIATRADCFAGISYAQSTLVCPPPVCGNGMQEPEETCDDGNTTGGDSCVAGCRVATPTPTP